MRKEIFERLQEVITIILKQQKSCIDQLKPIREDPDDINIKLNKIGFLKYQKLDKKLDFIKKEMAFVLGISDLDMIDIINDIKIKL